MAVATLMIGFKFDSTTALTTHLKNKYFEGLNAGNRNNYTGTIYENWYGWTDAQKLKAYQDLYD